MAHHTFSSKVTPWRTTPLPQWILFFFAMQYLLTAQTVSTKQSNNVIMFQSDKAYCERCSENAGPQNAGHEGNWSRVVSMTGGINLYCEGQAA